MNGKQLKNSILQLAIQGKLVPQDPNDEPASVLLQRIRKEKERLLKGGKLKKKDLVETPISEDEKPFDIPESWMWVRLGEIASYITDGEQKTPRRITNFCGYYLLSARNVFNGCINLENVDYVDKEEYENISKHCNPQFGDVLISCSGSVGRTAVVKDNNNYVMVRSAAVVRPMYTDSDYLMYTLQSTELQSQIEESSKQTAQANLFQGAIKTLKIPLPPLAEQHRIVEKIEELMPFVEEYDKAQAKLDELNSKLPEALKKSILQEAIQGKLVPQDPNDEPATVLLQRIRKEKERLVKEGKLKKKDLISEPIADEEKPFDIPESWEWCRVSTILNILDSQRKPVSKEDREAGIYPYCGANGILDYVKHYIFDGKFILIGEDGSVVTKYGNPVVNKIEGKIWVNNHAHVVQEYGSLGYQDFIYYALKNTDISVFVHGFMPKYSQGDLRKTLIPLPPLAEQRRIVAKIEELFATVRFEEI